MGTCCSSEPKQTPAPASTHRPLLRRALRKITAREIELHLATKRVTDRWDGGNVIQISGCMDSQTSADTWESGPCGACTQAFLTTLQSEKDITVIDLVRKGREWMKEHNFKQLMKLTIMPRIQPCVTYRELLHKMCTMKFSPDNALREAAGATPPAKPRRRGLLIGINYKNKQAPHCTPKPNWALEGCISDQLRLYNYLVTECGWARDDLRLITDDPEAKKKGRPDAKTGWPTEANIKKNMKWLVEDRTVDSMWISFSGHGVNIQDLDGDEEDGLDEAMLTSDGNKIPDDWFYEHVTNKVPPSAQLFVLMDCCHSGTMMDLPLDVVFEDEKAVYDKAKKENHEVQELLAKWSAPAK